MTQSILASASLIDIEAHFLKQSKQWSPIKETTSGGFNVTCPWCSQRASLFISSNKNLLFKCWHDDCCTKGKVKGVSKYIKKVCPLSFWEEFAKACEPHWQKIWGKPDKPIELENDVPSRYPSLFEEETA